jgi:hypothetical protein
LLGELDWRDRWSLQRTRSCLTALGLRVVGGPALGLPASGPDTPLGELIVVRGAAPTFIAFYTGREAARRSEPTLIQNGKRVGGVVARRGAVTVFWSRPPTSAQRAAVAACAFT